jgi:branched-subunit amino acid ABC-type transport system permease component
MPIFIAALLGGLISAAGTLVGKVLISIGFGYVAYTGLSTSLDWIKDQIAGSMAGLPAQSMAVLSALNAGEGISILISAFGVRLLLDGLTNGSIKRLVLK